MIKLQLLFKQLIIVSLTIGYLSFPTFSPAQDLQTPEQFFGFKPGTDKMLFNYEQMIAYLQKLDAFSDKIKITEIGKSPLGKPMHVVFISSENNIKQLDELKIINKKLAIDPEIPENELTKLVQDGKVFLMISLSMHSNEVGPAQAFPDLAYQLLTSKDEQTLSILENVVIMVVPNQNPDGMDMIVDHYNKYKNTKYERCTMPGIYHRYTGHDNNRDYVLLTQQDVRNVARLYNTEWYPQVLVDKHQMGMDGTRYFVPPYHDPISENIEAELWNWAGVYGAQLMKDMTEDGLKGVSQHVDFDNYWPGSTETSMWKNVVSFLTEAASAQYASPVFIEPSELVAEGKGLAEYKKSINMPLPWPGGWWKLSDIVSYEIVSMKSILATTSANKEKLLKFRNLMCKKQVNLGKTQAPYYYILPQNQHDKSELIALIRLLKEHGVFVYSLQEDFQIDQQLFKKEDIVVPLSQPYRAFIKEVMEKQKYPVRHYMPDGEMIKPYDITSWSLPLSKGLISFQIEKPQANLENKISAIDLLKSLNNETPENYTYAIFNSSENESYAAAFKALEKNLNVYRLDSAIKLDQNTKADQGSFALENSPQANEFIKSLDIRPVYITGKKSLPSSLIKMPRIALVETWFSDMEGGWTRYVLDNYSIPYKVIRPGEFEKTDLSKNFDVLIVPDNNKDILMLAKRKKEDSYDESKFPPEYAKGIGEEGLARIMTFVDGGGIVLAWGESVNLFTGSLKIKREKETEEFKLPFENNSEQLEKKGFYVPGSLFRINIIENHSLTYGMNKDAGVFYEGKQVFTTRIPNFDMDRRIIATFPEENILMSGYAENYEKIANMAAMLWIKKGKGQFVFYSFSPTYRAYTTGVYKLVFNALLLKKLQ